MSCLGLPWGRASVSGTQDHTNAAWDENGRTSIDQYVSGHVSIIRRLKIVVRLRNRVRERFFNSSLHASHYHTTCPSHPMNYHLFLKPTWRAKALEKLLVRNSKIVFEIKSTSPQLLRSLWMINWKVWSVNGGVLSKWSRARFIGSVELRTKMCECRLSVLLAEKDHM